MILEAKTDIGKIRDTNEDVANCLMHPKDKKIKLLLVADGMGGKEHGDIAANFIASSLENWFINKSVEDFKNIEEIEKKIKTYLKTLNTKIINKYGRNTIGTTLTLALVLNKKTLIINVGDSRAYIYRQRRLIQISEDDADVWLLYKSFNVKKDDLRYFVNNNIINACIGIDSELCTPTSYIVDNDYEMLLLFSDGVTDMLTDKKLLKIIQKSRREELLENIIDEAVEVDQHLKVPLYLKRKFKTKFVVPFNGRDNASGAIYIK